MARASSSQSGSPFGRQSGLTAVLDIGTAKTVCVVAGQHAGRTRQQVQPAGNAGLRVLGVGHQQSRGVKAGVIVDLAEAEECVRAVLAQAERMAGVTLEQVLLSVSCGRLASHTVTASAEIGGSHVTARDVARLMAGARSYVERDGRILVHLNRKATQLDGALGGADVIGMAAHQMTARLHAVSADEAPIRNFRMLLERCHIRVSGLVPASMASALAVTTEDERQLGVTVIDIGCGTTKLAKFSGGHLEHIRSVPIGSHLITSDIARALHTPLIEAERIKALYGNLISARSDEHETFSYPSAGQDEGLVHHATRAQLTSIIRPRAAEILRSVLNVPGDVRPDVMASDALVLTGGGCLLTGISEFASEVFQRPVRKGQVADVSGLPPVASGPGFATAAGLLFASQDRQEHAHLGAVSSERRDADGYFQRVGAWLKSGF